MASSISLADAADAGDEDHRGGCHARHVDGVVAGAADDVLMPVALRRSGLATSLAQVAVHLGQHLVLGMAEIDGEEHPAGDRVARVRADLDKTDRAAGIGRMRVPDPVDRIDHPRRTDQRVPAPRHPRTTFLSPQSKSL